MYRGALYWQRERKLEFYFWGIFILWQVILQKDHYKNKPLSIFEIMKHISFKLSFLNSIWKYKYRNFILHFNDVSKVTSHLQSYFNKYGRKIKSRNNPWSYDNLKRKWNHTLRCTSTISYLLVKGSIKNTRKYSTHIL